jgi:hypothetical protein
MTDDPQKQGGSRERLGLRGFLAQVNLKDFSDMVATEARLIPASVGAAWKRGPWFLPLALIVALIRLVLLIFVIVVFGAAILLITAGRAIFGRGS